MARRGAGTAIVAMLALGACSDRSAQREDVAHAALAQQPVSGSTYGPQPLLGPAEAGFRLPPSGDFNQDGMQDVLWRDHTANRIAVTLMSGTRPLEHGPWIPGPPGADWVVLNAAGDFNADGMADVLWYDPTTNRMAVWLMRGTAPFERGPEIPGPPGDGWTCAPALDFNDDGMADVLWYNPTTNRMAVWLMRGTAPFERGPEIPGPEADRWLASFAGDFDRDGMADVLWYDPRTNRMAVWLMAGTEVREAGLPLPGPSGDGWILASAGDFNHDFIADELWFNTANKRMTVSLMGGTRLLEQGPEIPGLPGAGWVVGNAADCNGDGMTDVLWLNPSPLRLRVWLMDGAVPLASGADVAGPE